jgi:hypothetical protein
LIPILLKSALLLLYNSTHQVLIGSGTSLPHSLNIEQWAFPLYFCIDGRRRGWWNATHLAKYHLYNSHHLRHLKKLQIFQHYLSLKSDSLGMVYENLKVK